MKSVDIIYTNRSNNKPPQPKQKKCLKFVIIFLTILVVLAVVFILVAKFKYNFFKKDIYQVAKIKRDIDSTEYFLEKKTMTSNLIYSNGESQNSEQIVVTKFVVMITDRLNLENDDYLNTAALIILESKIQIEGKEAQLDSLNIFDDEEMAKFEENQEEAKYPMAIFHFYKNGTLKDIQVPKNSSKDDIYNMEDLISKVSPKLLRNKTEDEISGIQIITKDDKKKKSFTEYESQREYANKYTNSSFKGSKITKAVERDIEDEKLTEVRENTTLYMETQKKEEDTYLDFGIENFNFDVSSEIMAYEMKENKNDKDLIRKVISKQLYEDSEELLKLILEKEKEGQNENIIEKSENTTEKENQLRNLGLLDGKLDFNWTIVEFNVLGIEIKAVYYISLSGGKIKNYLQFQSGSIVVPIGNTNGKNTTGSEKLPSKERVIAKIPILPLVSISLKILPDTSHGLSAGNNYLDINFSGSISAKAGLEFGVGKVAKIEAGVKGNILSGNFIAKIQQNYDGNYKKYIKMEANSGRFEIYAIGYVLGWKVLDKKQEIWKGWSKTWII